MPVDHAGEKATPLQQPGWFVVAVGLEFRKRLFAEKRQELRRGYNNMGRALNGLQKIHQWFIPAVCAVNRVIIVPMALGLLVILICWPTRIKQDPEDVVEAIRKKGGSVLYDLDLPEAPVTEGGLNGKD